MFLVRIIVPSSPQYSSSQTYNTFFIMSVSSLVSPVTIQTKSEESTFAEQLTHSHLTSSNFDANLLLREHEDATEHLAIRGARVREEKL